MPGSKKKRLKPIHPGEVLQEVLDEAGLTANALALALRIPANRIGAIVKGQRGITADTAAARTLFQDIRPDMDESPGQVRIGGSRRLSE
jgi:addiction module HigA family antidote